VDLYFHYPIRLHGVVHNSAEGHRHLTFSCLMTNEFSFISGKFMMYYDVSVRTLREIRTDHLLP
jgi:hypothetical protein